MKNFILTLKVIFCIAYINPIEAQNVYIPDSIFKLALLNNVEINKNNDTNIQVYEASSFRGVFSVDYLAIEDLTGIEAFTSISNISCVGNKLTKLDISKNFSLTYLNCSANQLTQLDVSNNPVLVTLNCFENKITTLDVSKNSELSRINCESNLLTNLDVSKNTSLTILQCGGNLLTYLDVSKNFWLGTLRCEWNNLNGLNLKNGNNRMLNIFYAELNPNLLCIEVDNPMWSANNWKNVDSIVKFTTNCTNITSGVNKIKKLEHLVFPNPTSGKLYLTEKTDIILTDMLGKIVLLKPNTNYIDISEMPSGIYILIAEGTNQVIKVIKE